MPEITLGLRDGIIIKEAPGGGAELQSDTGVWPLKEASPGAARALVRLVAGGATKEELEEIACEADWFLGDEPLKKASYRQLGDDAVHLTPASTSAAASTGGGR